MPVRMTGMISGMDTESLIKSMVDAQRLKNKKTTDKSTLLEWKQDKLKDLNAKLFKLYQEDLSKLRLQGTYNVKKVTSSNDKLIEVTANNGASTGTNTVEVNKLASAQSVTSTVIKMSDGSTVNAGTKLKELIAQGKFDTLSKYGQDGVININYKGKDTNLVIDENTTLGDLVDTLKRAGLNASFDNDQKRLYISSKNSGADEKFTITSSKIDSSAAKSLSDIAELLKSSSLGLSGRASVMATLDNIKNQMKDVNGITFNELYDKATDVIQNGTTIAGTDAEKNIIKALVDLQKNVANSTENKVKQEAITAEKEEIRKAIVGTPVDDEAKKNSILSHLRVQAEKEAAKAGIEEDEVEEWVNQRVDTKYENLEKATDGNKDKMIDILVTEEYNSTEPSGTDGLTKAAEYQQNIQTRYDAKIGTEKATALNSLKTDTVKYVTASISATTSFSLLTDLGMDNIKLDEDGNVLNSGDGASAMKVVGAADAEFVFNGVKYNNSSNVLTVNGYTITAKGVTGEQAVTLNTINDTQANYDMIKKFVANYNAILKEMNELFYAPSARGYAPLSDDEKEAMSEKQIDKWEDKIKSSILRRDDSVGTLLNVLNTGMMSSIEVDGKKYSLASLGIKTSSDYTEKGLLHIDGDADDALVSTLTNKLMEALEKDPELVGKVVSGIAMNVYDAMSNSMKAIPNIRSAFTFYNDKTMAKEQTEYQKKIKLLEKKVVDVENKYYKQFAAMESALSKLQSQTSALAGMLGTTPRQ